MRLSIPTVRLPGRNGLLFMGGMTLLAVGGVVSAPVALALGALPVLDANVANGGLTTSGGAGRTRAATATARRRTAAPRQRRVASTASSATTAPRASATARRSPTRRRRVDS